VRDPEFQGLHEPTAGDRTGPRNRSPDARERQVPRVLPGDDLRGFPGGSGPGGWEHGSCIAFTDPADPRSSIPRRKQVLENVQVAFRLELAPNGHAPSLNLKHTSGFVGKSYSETASVAKAAGNRKIFKVITFSHGAGWGMTRQKIL
jgi:hypothetical protein